MGDPILRKKCKKVTGMDGRIIQLIEDMFNTMHEAGGVGLAAPQVGVLKRICVVDCGMDNPDPHLLINPDIVYAEGEQKADEGCLSVPGYKGTVTRAEKIKVKFLDQNMQEEELEAEGLLARCIQHETDHLEGILYVDKVEGELKEANEEESEESSSSESSEDAMDGAKS